MRNQVTGVEPLALTSVRMRRGVDALFVAVVAVSASRDPRVLPVVSAGVLLAMYATRPLTVRDPRSHIVWLWVLTVWWAAAVVFVSVEFVWVSVPLLFLHLLTFALRPALAIVAAITGIVITAEALDDGLTVAEVAGPLLGAGFAVVACVSYRTMMIEHTNACRALAELETARLKIARSDHERGMLDERRRVAREVHDTIAQDLASILLLARSPQSTRSVATIETLASRALHEARRIVDALGPLGLEATSLADALSLLETTDENDSPTVEFAMSGAPRQLPQPHETMLLRVAQSALANSKEHARASTVFITLSYLDDEVAIDVVDDGRGFEPCEPVGSEPTRSFGFSVMRERAQQVGGTVVVESRRGSGTAVHAAVPTS